MEKYDCLNLLDCGGMQEKTVKEYNLSPRRYIRNIIYCITAVIAKSFSLVATFYFYQM